MEAVLIIADSESSSDLYYATGFLAPDPYVFLIIGSERIMIVSDLEIDRARAKAAENGLVDTVVPSSELEKRVESSAPAESVFMGIVSLYLQERGVDSILVPALFPIEYGDALREKGFSVCFKRGSFFEEREVKTAAEIEKISKAVEATEGAMEHAIGIIGESIIKGDRLFYMDQVLTSEIVKKNINLYLMERGYLAQHTIVSSGSHCCDPHNTGNGPIKPNESVIIDIFPRSLRSRYFADMTRTVVRGRPTPKLERAYNAVLEAQEIAFEVLKDGVNGKSVHSKIQNYFERLGFHTGVHDGRMEGFFHGTGHGVGLDIHESPRINKTDSLLVENNVVTVEPGLYYRDFGGVRLEDIVVIKKKGCINMNKCNKLLIL